MVPFILINRDKKGEDVYLVGTLAQNKKIKLTNDLGLSPKERSVIIHLRPGLYYYNFIVDDVEVIDPSVAKQEFNGKLMNVVNVAKYFSRNKVNQLMNLDSIPLGQTNTNYQNHKLLLKKLDQPEDYPSVAIDSGTLEYDFKQKINIQKQDAISEKSSVKNISLQKNLSKLKTYNSKNLSTLNDFSQNFSINLENNVANNLITTYQHFNTSDQNDTNLLTPRNQYFNMNRIIIVYKLNNQYLVPMQISHEDNKTIALKHVKLL
jgi:hypothetical protein